MSRSKNSGRLGRPRPHRRLRARHVLTENDRVRRGAEALKAGDVAAFGRLMSASHASSRDDFANSSPALDALIEAAEESPGFLGGKLSGAGWAGCTVNLVAADQAEAFAEAVRTGYAGGPGSPDIHVCHAADGASRSADRWSRSDERSLTTNGRAGSVTVEFNPVIHGFGNERLASAAVARSGLRPGAPLAPLPFGLPSGPFRSPGP